MEKVKITFASGVKIEAEVNGSCYIIDEPLNENIQNDLSVVTIENKDGVRTEFTDAELIIAASIDGRFWFSFREVSAEERLRADIDYLLLMVD